MFKIVVMYCRTLPAPFSKVSEYIKALNKRYLIEECSEVRCKLVWLMERLCHTVGYDYTYRLQDFLLKLQVEGMIIAEMFIIFNRIFLFLSTLKCRCFSVY